MFLNETKEEFHYSTDRAIWDAVGKTHTDLLGSERMMVIRQLEIALDRYEFEILQIYLVRVHLYNLYNEKIQSEKAVSTFSRDFNMSIRGHNAQVGAKVDELMSKAFNYDAIGQHSKASSLLQSLRLRHSVLYGNDTLEVIKACAKNNDNNAKAALNQWHWVLSYRQVLFESVIKLATHLGKKTYASLSGDVIAQADLIHEAIMAAKEAIEMYQPRDEGKTFTSFINNWVSGTISKYVNENTRTVAVPRTLIDRYRPILEAIEKLGTTDIEPVAKMATKILYDKRQQSRGTKLRPSEVYTPDEVFRLHQIMQDAASLDVEVNTDRIEDPTTLGERLVSEAPTQEEQLDLLTAANSIMRVVADYTSSEEYALMELRWGMGKVMGLKQAAEIYRCNTGRPMNKGKLAEIEQDVLGRLRRGVKEGDNRLIELKEVLDD